MKLRVFRAAASPADSAELGSPSALLETDPFEPDSSEGEPRPDAVHVISLDEAVAAEIDPEHSTPEELSEAGSASGSTTKHWWDRALDGLEVACEIVAAVAIFALAGTTCANAIMRYLLHSTIPWQTDFTTIAMNAAAFLGMAALIRRGGGIAFTFVTDRMSPRQARIARASAMWLVLAIALLSLKSFPQYLSGARQTTFANSGWNQGWEAIWIGIGLVVSVIFVLEILAKLGLRTILLGLIVPAVVGAVVIYWHNQGDAFLYGVNPLWAGAILVVVMFAVGTPIPYVLAAAALGTFYASGAPIFSGVTSTYANAVSNPVLSAVPFFLLAGAFVQCSGLARKVGHFLENWLGQFPGGLLIASIGAMFVFSGVSGSKTADVAAVSSALKPSLDRAGYPAEENTAVIASAASVGETIPPSTFMIILAYVTTLSVAGLFAAGILPAVVGSLAMVAAVIWRARGGRLPKGPGFRIGPAVRSVPGVIPVLVIPAVMLFGVLGGVVTATEAGSLAVIYGILIVILYVSARKMSAKELWPIIRNAAVLSGMVFWLLATASLATQAIVLGGLPNAVLHLLTHVDGKITFLLITAFALIIFSMLFEALPVLLIMAPVLIPVGTALGLSSLQVAIVILMSIGIGAFLPPFGVALYLTAAIMETSPVKAFRACVFYSTIHVVGLVLVILVPVLTTWLPGLTAK